MRVLTLTPDAQLYAMVALGLCAAMCAPLAGYVQAWCPSPPDFLPVYVGTMSVVATLSLVMLDVPSVTGGAGTALVLSLPVGLTAGSLAIWADSAVRRLTRGRRLARGSSASSSSSRNLPTAGAAGRDRVGVRPFGGRSSRLRLLALLVAVATLEEVLFRGVLVDMSLGLSSPVAVGVTLTLALLAFALSHVYWGWPEVLAKSFLGTFALVPVLVLETVAPAIVAHVLFNVWAWTAARATTAPAAV